jgi:hypothetical protein
MVPMSLHFAWWENDKRPSLKLRVNKHWILPVATAFLCAVCFLGAVAYAAYPLILFLWGAPETPRAFRLDFENACYCAMMSFLFFVQYKVLARIAAFEAILKAYTAGAVDDRASKAGSSQL